MKKFLKIVLIRVFFLTTLLAFCGLQMQAQTTDQQLAAFYFQEEDYEKAALYYERLYVQNSNDFFYNYYLQCLTKLERFKEAKKLIKNQLRVFPNNQNYQIDLGEIYILEGEDKKAKKQYQQSIENLKPISGSVISLANAFIEAGEYEYALKTFERGDILLNHTFPFNIEKARLYGRLGNYELMFDEYLKLLELSPNYLQSIQNELARNLAFDQNASQNQILKQILLRNIQKKPNQSVFYELLTWVYIQEKNYAQALRQSKALDKRQKEGGEKVMQIAYLALSAEQYDIAIDAFDYVVAQGSGPHYVRARVGLLDVLKTKLTSQYDFSIDDAKKLESSYLNSIAELGMNTQTIKIYRDLAQIEAYYLQNPDTAITLITEALKFRRIDPQERANCKLELADIYVIQGFIWDASLLYSQVDKDYKHDRLGEIAKFKNARISYYTGDFNWAKAQLDVLKGSTSKLIANDAMDLSLLITDNTGVDTTETPMKMFARADLLLQQNKFDQVTGILDSIIAEYPGHALTDEILMRKAEISLKLKEYDSAKKWWTQVVDQHAFDITADDALYKLGELYQYHYQDNEMAMKQYERIMLEFSNSMYVVDARKQFRILRGDFNNL